MSCTLLSTSLIDQEIADTASMKFVVWIDANCGNGIETDWEINGGTGYPGHAEPMQQALAHAAWARSRGFPAVLMPPGQTPRPDGLFSNPETDPL